MAGLQSSSLTTSSLKAALARQVRRELLKQADVQTLLRLPTGIFYAQGVKANVLFFDRKPASEKPWTEKLWIYDLRTNQHFTLKEKTLKRTDLDEFVQCFHPENRHERTESERFKCFAYGELLKRDKVNLDIFWLKDESLEDSAKPPDPDVLALEIAEELEAALGAFFGDCRRLETVSAASPLRIAPSETQGLVFADSKPWRWSVI
jgi:type I restriction enzyme M protein